MGSTMWKDNQNWQNISQLPLMRVQLHKMHRDTIVIVPTPLWKEKHLLKFSKKNLS